MDEKQDQANDILSEVIKEITSFDDFKIVGKPTLPELIIHLEKNKSNPLAMTALIGLAEQMYLSQILEKNLLEATRLLQDHHIPFNSVVEVDE